MLEGNACRRRADVCVGVHEAREHHRAPQVGMHARGWWPACSAHGLDASSGHSKVNKAQAVGIGGSVCKRRAGSWHVSNGKQD